MKVATAPRPLRIVVADDSEPIVLGVRNFLSRHAGLSVVGTGANGREAIEQVACHSPDLIILDIRMPELDGLVATAVIHERFPATRILIVSMNGDLATRTAAFAQGADGFLPKLLMHRRLVQEIERLFPELQEEFPA